MEWIQLAQERYEWRAVFNAVKNFLAAIRLKVV